MIAEYYKLLKEYIGFKTISNDKNFDEQLKFCSSWLKDLFIENGFNVEIANQNYKPIIIASYIKDDSLETGMIYGHYDILSANQEDGWKENPFNLLIGRDKIVARGIYNKGQTLIHMVNVFNLIKENRLGYNIIFLLEGEKETGSIGLNNYLQTNSNKIKVDFILLSNGNLFNNITIIESGFRGNINAQLEVTNANNELNTGLYSSIIANPLNELTKLLSKLHDSNNQVTIPYFYYEVEELSASQKTLNTKIPFDYKSITNNLNTNELNLKNIDFFSKVGRNPSIEITNIYGGESGCVRESIPNKATANLNFKLVSNQKCESIKSLFTERVKNNLPNELKYNIIFSECYKATKINTQNYFVDKASELLQKTHNNKVYHIQSGQSLPIISSLQEHISNKIISVPLINPDSNKYGANENFDIDLIEKGLKFSYEFFKK